MKIAHLLGFLLIGKVRVKEKSVISAWDANQTSFAHLLPSLCPPALFKHVENQPPLCSETPRAGSCMRILGAARGISE